MSYEKELTESVQQMATELSRVLDMENVPALDLAKGLIATMGDRPEERKLIMMATSYAAALKIIAVAKRNTPTEEGEKEL